MSAESVFILSAITSAREPAFEAILPCSAKSSDSAALMNAVSISPREAKKSSSFCGGVGTVSSIIVFSVISSSSEKASTSFPVVSQDRDSICEADSKDRPFDIGS